MVRRFLIVEDHPLYADALQLVICNAMADVRTTHAGTLREAVEAIHRENRFDLVLLDLKLPDSHGFEGLIELRGLLPRLPIVIISAFAEQSVMQKCLVCGASGFIAKTASRDTILQALADVLAGHAMSTNGSPAPDTAASAAASAEEEAVSARLRALTHQQLRVLQMLCRGLLNKQIAYQLNIGETTVKAHITEILRKLSVCSRTQAVAEVSKLNLDAMLALYARAGNTSPAQLTRSANGGGAIG